MDRERCPPAPQPGLARLASAAAAPYTRSPHGGIDGGPGRHAGADSRGHDRRRRPLSRRQPDGARAARRAVGRGAARHDPGHVLADAARPRGTGGVPAGVRSLRREGAPRGERVPPDRRRADPGEDGDPARRRRLPSRVPPDRASDQEHHGPRVHDVRRPGRVAPGGAQARRRRARQRRGRAGDRADRAVQDALPEDVPPVVRPGSVLTSGGRRAATGSVLGLRALNRTLLERQLLLDRVPMAPLAATEHLVGLQAQNPWSPYHALHARLRDFDPATLSDAMDRREAVRMVLMRGTIHLVSARDAATLRPVIQPVLDRELFATRTWGPGVAGVNLEPILAFARELVEAEPRSMQELRAAIAQRWPDLD